ncbi:MAG: hypothetical protein RI894_1045 [Bacteroidota bacterium]|jgi:hypothetical protein
MTQITISIANEAKYKALLAFIAQEGDIFVETPPKSKRPRAITKSKNEPIAANTTVPKIDLSQFCGIIKPAQSIEDIDAELTEMRQEWERSF